MEKQHNENVSYFLIAYLTTLAWYNPILKPDYSVYPQKATPRTVRFSQNISYGQLYESEVQCCLQFVVRSVLLNTEHSEKRHGRCTYEERTSEPKRCKAVESTRSTLKKINDTEENPKEFCDKFPQLRTGLGPTSSYPIQCEVMLLVVTLQVACFERQRNKNGRCSTIMTQAFTSSAPFPCDFSYLIKLACSLSLIQKWIANPLSLQLSYYIGKGGGRVFMEKFLRVVSDEKWRTGVKAWVN